MKAEQPVRIRAGNPLSRQARSRDRDVTSSPFCFAGSKEIHPRSAGVDTSSFPRSSSTTATAEQRRAAPVTFAWYVLLHAELPRHRAAPHGGAELVRPTSASDGAASDGAASRHFGNRSRSRRRRRVERMWCRWSTRLRVRCDFDEMIPLV
ncbi:hypothetical protein F2P81_024623 [Scophthalmus maximus]|uniref:Uncharacterized protein n=1 Tax=Scophthalmus maximus TaxID=52904 RepID=A0A6A4RPV7_SCOMX|nr:hypothetical protein F2P81_024623 [Scophthalmus maximus]